MKLKMKLADFERDLVSGELARRRPQTAQALGWGLNTLLGLLLSAVPLLGSCGPFGVAAAAIGAGRVGSLLCALGASVGYLAFFGFALGIRQVAAVALVFTVAYVCQDLRVQKTPWFMPAVAAFCTALTGALGSFTAVKGQSSVLPIVVQTLFSGAGAYFFREALRTEKSPTETGELRHTVALVVLLACLLMALAGVRVGPALSVGRMLALVFALLFAFRCGPLWGAAAGLALGLAMDIAGPAAPFYSMTYGFSGLISGVFARHGRVRFLVVYVLSAAVCVICCTFNGVRAETLYELFVAGAVFLALPRGALTLFTAVVHPAVSGSGELSLRRYAAGRIRKVGEAFADLYATVDGALAPEHNDEDLSRVFDRASELVCRKCRNKSACWNSNFMDTLAAFNDVTPQIRERGVIVRDDLPAHFTEQCLQPDALVNAINGELRSQMYRRRFRARLAENRRAAYSQYADVSEVLAAVGEELENACGADGLIQRRLARCLAGSDIDAEVSVFRDRGGRLHIVMESPKLRSLLREPGWLDRLSAAAGLRLCRPNRGEAECDGRVLLMEAEPLSVSVGIASLKKKGEPVSGDRGTYFKTEQGVLCILLSDGMGSGESAARESVAVVRILERFLRAGVDPAVAMKMLNSMMLLKNDDSWGFATVDLMTIDLFTGESTFYKYGAAPSYVRSGKTVKRIRSETLAAGLRVGDEALPDVVKLRLKPGCLALIASDGVIAETDDAWLRQYIAGCDASDTKSVARGALQGALKQYGCGDDMTVLAIRVDQRE